MWRDSLILMRNGLIHNYDPLNTMSGTLKSENYDSNTEETHLQILNYRLNEGKRRLLDAIEILDRAIRQIEQLSIQEASRLYLMTIREVFLLTKMASLLERAVLSDIHEAELSSQRTVTN